MEHETGEQQQSSRFRDEENTRPSIRGRTRSSPASSSTVPPPCAPSKLGPLGLTAINKYYYPATTKQASGLRGFQARTRPKLHWNQLALCEQLRRRQRESRSDQDHRTQWKHELQLVSATLWTCGGPSASPSHHRRRRREPSEFAISFLLAHSHVFEYEHLRSLSSALK